MHDLAGQFTSDLTTERDLLDEAQARIFMLEQDAKLLRERIATLEKQQQNSTQQESSSSSSSAAALLFSDDKQQQQQQQHVSSNAAAPPREQVMSPAAVGSLDWAMSLVRNTSSTQRSELLRAMAQSSLPESPLTLPSPSPVSSSHQRRMPTATLTPEGQSVAASMLSSMPAMLSQAREASSDHRREVAELRTTVAELRANSLVNNNPPWLMQNLNLNQNQNQNQNHVQYMPPYTEHTNEQQQQWWEQSAVVCQVGHHHRRLLSTHSRTQQRGTSFIITVVLLLELVHGIHRIN
jgi:hypothetical protein